MCVRVCVCVCVCVCVTEAGESPVLGFATSSSIPVRLLTRTEAQDKRKRKNKSESTVAFFLLACFSSRFFFVFSRPLRVVRVDFSCRARALAAGVGGRGTLGFCFFSLGVTVFLLLFFVFFFCTDKGRGVGVCC